MMGAWRRRCSFSTARDCKHLALLEEEKANALGFCFLGSADVIGILLLLLLSLLLVGFGTRLTSSVSLIGLISVIDRH